MKIYIDQGHNPVNPNAGAEGNGYREQDLVFTIGLILAGLLRSDGFEVRLSRPTPESQLGTSNATSLSRRTTEANLWGADLFVSLHCNASDDPRATGTEVLVYSMTSAAYPLARKIAAAVSENTGLPNRGVKLRPGLYVLRKTVMPAVLCELGFITNPYDVALLADDPQLFAEGVRNGIVAQYG